MEKKYKKDEEGLACVFLSVLVDCMEVVVI